ncbi:MAG: hypothetical protein NZ480_09325 [Bdellovibrionaceae bacterium]|nr:hypothetical protein [Pseudobdellovibrionaceae bacterium]MDW8189749.1 hypothetical protein [Pseudobdellovibrionaceae bacterium]
MSKVIMVPFFEAKRAQLQRHIDFFERLGIPVVVVDLTYQIPWLQLWRFGSMRSLWVYQIEQVIKNHPEPKIIFSFSNPSSAVLEVLSRIQCHNVKALICDSGPGTGFIYSVFKLLKHYRGLTNPILLYPLTLILFLVWGPAWDWQTRRAVARLPDGFPILTIEGGRDPLISPDQIDDVFCHSSRIRWKRLLLPEAQHLNGLKDFGDIYLATLKEFLAQC